MYYALDPEASENSPIFKIGVNSILHIWNEPIYTDTIFWWKVFVCTQKV